MVMVWWREMKSVTVGPQTLTPAGRGTPAVNLVIAPSMELQRAGEDCRGTAYTYLFQAPFGSTVSEKRQPFYPILPYI